MIKQGDRVIIQAGTGYTWHDSGIAKFRRVESELKVTVTSVKGLTFYGKTDSGTTVELKYNSACMYVEE